MMTKVLSVNVINLIHEWTSKRHLIRMLLFLICIQVMSPKPSWASLKVEEGEGRGHEKANLLKKVQVFHLRKTQTCVIGSDRNLITIAYFNRSYSFFLYVP